MAKSMLIDEFHLTVYATHGLAEVVYEAIRQTLDDKRLQADLRQAVRTVFRKYPSLHAARARITR